eukprot:CAMPEP_0185568214 /NCGR_PEP_ID=MMETSP0434-20130131/1244_1 /TAXON_ID=626734 ORGANISM="Favella taraikaensis, Strain Fe Narragansett Bay" /NCGR_SAMPLE_ID=MMETSP0434 /ASSEMBLY_ACC=CAM_ASM_000379 /LENGTH=46 /DNA_ID= /DNA_START= /DNA_END= /DNA_ORIENTATION=
MRSALKNDLSSKSKQELKMRSNLREGVGRSSFRILGAEKTVSFDVR